MTPRCVAEDSPAPWFFAADVHLDGRPEGRDRFARFLADAERAGASVVVLGDLFHYWYGRKHLELPMYRDELELLRGATARGATIAVVPGNRDYLLEEEFTRATGVEVWGEGSEVRFGDERVHLSHGDAFATADRGYVWLRRILRSRMLLFLAHHAPRAWVSRVARRIRGHSQRVVGQKPSGELAPDLEEVRDLFRRGFRTVLCGHFHRQRDESFPPEEGGGRFIVLEPFEERGSFLAHTFEGWETRRIGTDGSEES